MNGYALSTESEIQTTILDYMKLCGIFCWRNNSVGIYDTYKHQYRRPPKHHLNGVPDILGILPNGQFLGIEVKSKRGKLSQAQQAFANFAKIHGGLVFIARSIEDVKSALRDFLPKER